MDPEQFADDLLAATSWAAFGAVLDQAGVDGPFVDGPFADEMEKRRSRLVQVQQLARVTVTSQVLA